jgi:predicted nucleic acid-binding protein
VISGRVLVDTSIVVHIFEGNKDLAEALDGADLFISVITLIELYSWPRESEKRKLWLDEFIAECLVIELTRAIQQKTIAIRRSSKLHIPDAIIAASAIHLDMSFLTTDKDFQKCGPDLKLTLYKP